MNIRVVSLVLVVLVFALISGTISYSVSGGMPLKEAYNTGKITVVQQTAPLVVLEVLQVIQKEL